MSEFIEGEPPLSGPGYVVYPDPRYPHYTFSTVETYWLRRPRRRCGPYSTPDLAIGRAWGLAEPLNHDVWFVAETGGKRPR
jgi:hypothetical protein